MAQVSGVALEGLPIYLKCIFITRATGRPTPAYNRLPSSTLDFDRTETALAKVVLQRLRACKAQLTLTRNFARHAE